MSGLSERFEDESGAINAEVGFTSPNIASAIEGAEEEDVTVADGDGSGFRAGRQNAMIGTIPVEMRMIRSGLIFQERIRRHP